MCWATRHRRVSCSQATPAFVFDVADTSVLGPMLE